MKIENGESWGGMSWITSRIGDLGQVITGKTPPTKERRYFNGQYPFITPSDLEYDSFRVTNTATTVSEDANLKFANQFISKHAVMFTCIASVGKIGVAITDSLTNQQINSIVVNDKHDWRFVYYLLRHEARRILGMCSGVAAPIINKGDFEKITIKVPKYLTTEKRIASILSTYDDLIENNRRRIQLLEQASRLLYKEWFVHLRFPGHQHTTITNGVPEGWERKPIGDIAPFKYGKALKKNNRDPGPYPVYGSSGVIGTHKEAMATGPAIIIGRKGNVGSVFWSESDFYPIDTVYYIETENCTTYLYYALLNAQFINTDVAVPGLNRDFAHSRQLLISDIKTLGIFEEHTTAIHSQIDQMTRHSNALSRARDLLLPRLISREGDWLPNVLEAVRQ